MMPTIRPLLVAALFVAAVIAGGCNWSDSSGGPVGNGSPPPPSQVPTPGSPTSLATEEPTAVPTAAATPVVYYEVTKAGEGGHGGPPLLDLPASISIDYTVNGTCEFDVVVAQGVPDTGLAAATLAMTVTGRTVSGTWPVALAPGRYYVNPGESVGCTFTVRVFGA